MSLVVNAIIRKGHTVLLCKRRPNRLMHPNSCGLPGGHVEPGESLEEALIREINEEIGLAPIRFEKLGVITESSPQTNEGTTYHIYLISTWQGGEPTMLGDEHSEIHWFKIDAACSLPDLAIAAYKPLFRSLL